MHLERFNVLGVSFDTKLQWENQVANALNRAQGAINAIKLMQIIDGE